MQDDPLNQPAPQQGAPNAFDAVILWGMVVLFGIVWILMVWFNRHPGDAMMDPLSTGVPVSQVDPTTQSVLLGAGVAIVVVGIGGGVRDSVRAARRRAEERARGQRATPGAAPPAARDCPVCGKPVDGGFRFCPHCGGAL